MELPDFGFTPFEDEHRRWVQREFPDSLDIVTTELRLLVTGLGLLGSLPLTAARDKRTLLAAILNRSFGSLLCSAKFTVRGYYTPGLTLIRSCMEDHLMFWEISTSEESQNRMWDDRWDREYSRRRSWLQIAQDFDRWLAANGMQPHMVHNYEAVYGGLSEMAAHARPKSLLSESFLGGSELHILPVQDFNRCLSCLGLIIKSAEWQLMALSEMAAPGDATDTWRPLAQRQVDRANEWYRSFQETVRQRLREFHGDLEDIK